MAAGVMKWGPLTIHQNGQVVKSLRATPAAVISSSAPVAHSLENVRLSLHLERFECNEPFSADIKCVIRFGEFGYELKKDTACQMRAGQTHGSAVVEATCMPVDFQPVHGTVMEVEYFMDEELLEKQSVSIKFLSQVAAE
ncbi:MAG TPA: hypothetical protein V6D22_08890 [Candidatus Obscuribacterales bacterium]